MRYKNTSMFAAVKLAEGNKVPREVQVLRVGKFNHPKYGAFEITSAVLAEMKQHFDNKVRGIDTAFDYFHESDKEASGWVQELVLKENNTELWAITDWTPKAEQKLAERELRYFSPDFAFQWKDPESGSIYKNVLFGGGLTNRPFVKEMQAIVADEKQGEIMNLEQAQARIKEVEAQNLKLSEEKKEVEQQLAAAPPVDKVAQLEQQIAALQAELQKAKSEKEVALAEKTKLEEDKKKSDEAKVLAEKEGAFNLLLTEGKACAAQKDAFIKGDMNEFIKLAQPLNMKATGGSGDQISDKSVEAIIKLAEEKQKANPRLNRGDAMSMAKKEIESKV